VLIKFSPSKFLVLEVKNEGSKIKIVISSPPVPINSGIRVVMDIENISFDAKLVT
jgi:hypothetical protein